MDWWFLLHIILTDDNINIEAWTNHKARFFKFIFFKYWLGVYFPIKCVFWLHRCEFDQISKRFCVNLYNTMLFLYCLPYVFLFVSLIVHFLSIIFVYFFFISVCWSYQIKYPSNYIHLKHKTNMRRFSHVFFLSFFFSLFKCTLFTVSPLFAWSMLCWFIDQHFVVFFFFKYINSCLCLLVLCGSVWEMWLNCVCVCSICVYRVVFFVVFVCYL